MGKVNEVDDRRAGQVIATAGADIYQMLDNRPDLELREDVRKMMYQINQVSASLLRGTTSTETGG